MRIDPASGDDIPANLSLWSRQFPRGLSAGIIVLAIGGFAWLAASAWAADCLRSGLAPWTTTDVPLHSVRWECWPCAGVAALLIAGALRVRRKAQGFKYSDLRNAGEGARLRARRIQRMFLPAIVAEWVGCRLAATLCLRFNRMDLSLARIFRNPPDTVTGAAGAIVSLALQAALSSSMRGVRLGCALAATMWITAIYVTSRADRLARNSETGAAQ